MLTDSALSCETAWHDALQTKNYRSPTNTVSECGNFAIWFLPGSRSFPGDTYRRSRMSSRDRRLAHFSPGLGGSLRLDTARYISELRRKCAHWTHCLFTKRDCPAGPSSQIPEVEKSKAHQLLAQKGIDIVRPEKAHVGMVASLTRRQIYREAARRGSKRQFACGRRELPRRREDT